MILRESLGKFPKKIAVIAMILNITQADIAANLTYGNGTIVKNDKETRKFIISNFEDRVERKGNWRLYSHLNNPKNTIVADNFGYLFDQDNDYIDQSLIPFLYKFSNINEFKNNYPEIWNYFIEKETGWLYKKLRKYERQGNYDKAEKIREKIEEIENTQDAIFIFRNKDLGGKFILLYFRNGQLQIATFTSPGTFKRRTSKGVYKTGYKENVHYSKKYQLTPMPNSTHLKGGYFLHMGGKVDGKGRSHGCIRVGGVASKELFEDIANNEKIPVVFYGYSIVQ